VNWDLNGEIGIMSGPLKGGRAWRWFLAAGAMYLAILAVTWAPAKGPNTIDLVPFQNEVRAIRAWQPGHLAWRTFSELALNVLLLVPFALLLARAFQLSSGPCGFVRPTLLLGCMGSVLIEVGQLFVPGRTTSITDVLANSAGVIIAVKIMCHGGAGRA
jgi:glycopeptide antibiotics resistance protein